MIHVDKSSLEPDDAAQEGLTVEQDYLEDLSDPNEVIEQDDGSVIIPDMEDPMQDQKFDDNIRSEEHTSELQSH